MHHFYIYKHIRLDTNTIFYIGKGKNSRAYDRSTRNQHWKNIVSKHGYRVEFEVKGLLESEAYIKEVELIALYKAQGQCEANKSAGGEYSATGVIQTEEHKQKIAKAQVGSKNHMYGKTKENHPNYKKKLHSEAQRKKWSKDRRGILASEETKKKLSDLRIGSSNSFLVKNTAKKP